MVGYRTLAFTIATTLLGVLTTFNWVSVVNATTAGYIITGLGVIGTVLRFITKTPVGG